MTPNQQCQSNEGKEDYYYSDKRLSYMDKQYSWTRCYWLHMKVQRNWKPDEYSVERKSKTTTELPSTRWIQVCGECSRPRTNLPSPKWIIVPNLIAIRKAVWAYTESLGRGSFPVGADAQNSTDMSQCHVRSIPKISSKSVPRSV